MSNEKENVRGDGERGAGLISVLLIMALMLALAMGMTLTSISELGISNTYATHTTAFQVAEAGLSHAVSLVGNYNGADFTSLLAARGTNNSFPSNSAIFADNSEMIPATGRQMSDAVGTNGSLIASTLYQVTLIDDEPGVVPNFNPGTWENGNQATDINNRLVIYSTGTYANSSVTLEGWVGFVPYPALSAEGDITVWGNADIRGAYGGVHSNSNLAVGASANVAQTATATGSASISKPENIGGFYGGGQDRLDIPKFVTQDDDDDTDDDDEDADDTDSEVSPHIQPYLARRADRILIDGGFGNNTTQLQRLSEQLNVSVLSLQTAMDDDSNLVNGFTQNSAVALSTTKNSSGVINGVSRMNMSDTGWSGGSTWGISDETKARDKTYYIVGRDNYNVSNPSASTANGGNVKITGNPGPMNVTVLATGSIEVAGNPDFSANLRELRTPELPPFVKVDFLFVAVQDLKIRGDVDASQQFNGIVYAGEQFDLSGNGSFNGQVISLSNTHVNGSPVDANIATGSFELTFNNGSAVGRIRLLAWRQIKR